MWKSVEILLFQFIISIQYQSTVGLILSFFWQILSLVYLFRYAKHPSLSTGKVAALIHGDKRTLVAHLGAAEAYGLEDFKTSENLQLLQEEVLLVYIEGFFITHSVDVALEVIKICKSNGVVVAFNISGAYVAEFYADQLLAVIRLADIIIGNNNELKALGKAIGLKASSLLDLALESHLFLSKKDTSVLGYKLDSVKDFLKILLVTQGKDPVLCVYGSGQVVEYPVPPLDISLIKDSTGAGDSFAAGFLLSFIQGKPIVECIACGCAIAQKVIQNIGVVLHSD
jgi:adenosine kinase